MKKFLKTTAVAVLLHSSLCTAAQEEAKDSIVQTYNIEEFEIVGKKNISEIIPPRRLSGTTLQNLNSQSVADAVRYFSGVQVKDYGGIGGLKTINIRSMGTQQKGVFYDGIQMGNAQNGQVDLGRFSLDNIESISIYNGQKSPLLQSAKDYGSAGTIYLNTRRPDMDYVEPWYTHDISLGYNFVLGRLDNLYINADINNIFNQQYDVVLNYPIPGTNFKISASWEF